MAQRKNPRQSRRAPAYSADSMAVYLVIGLLLIALGLLIFLAVVIGMPGEVFAGVRQVSRGLAGGLAFLLPIFPVWGGGLLLMSVQRRAPLWPFVMACILFLLIAATAILLTYTGSPAIALMEYFYRVNSVRSAQPGAYDQFLARAYEQGAATGMSGGLLGMLLAWPVWTLLGAVPGAMVTILLAIVAALAMLRLTPKRIVALIQKGGLAIQRQSDARQQETYQQELRWQQEQMRMAQQQEQMRMAQQAAWQQPSSQVQQPYPAYSSLPYPQQEYPPYPQQEGQPYLRPDDFRNAGGAAPYQDSADQGFYEPYEAKRPARKGGILSRPVQTDESEQTPAPRRSIFGRPVQTDESEQASTPRRSIFQRPADDGDEPRRGGIFSRSRSQEPPEEQPAARRSIFQRPVDASRDQAEEAANSPRMEQTAWEEPAVPELQASWRGMEADEPDEYEPAPRKPSGRTQTPQESMRQPAVKTQPAEPVENMPPSAAPAESMRPSAVKPQPAVPTESTRQPVLRQQPAAAAEPASSTARPQANTPRVPQKPLDSWADTPPWEDGPEPPGQVVTPVLQSEKPKGAWEADLKLPPRRDVPAAQPSQPSASEQMEMEIPYVYPSMSLLKTPEPQAGISPEEDAIRSQRLEETLRSFRVPAKVRHITHGPAISRFELELAAGIKVNKVTDLNRNIAMNMEVKSVRIEAPIPGKSLVGVEIPNPKTATVTLREVLESEEMRRADKPLVVALGKDIAGTPIVCDLAKMPHLLIAGATGSGKSVCINTIINSLLFRRTPEEVRLILIDPKVVELQCYNGIPHLLIPVVSDPHKASGALAWAVGEMMDRYKKFEHKGVRAIDGFNASLEDGEPPMPRIVIIIDELADLMMTCKKDVEDRICRLAQLARAAGIHLVVATQRPSVDVITGIIKANIPSRIAFKVSSAIDSRTILDKIGAEQLLGYGDMLYQPTGEFTPIRVQGCFLTDGEVNRITDFIRENSPSDYDPAVLEQLDRLEQEAEGFSPVSEAEPVSDGDGDLLAQCIEMVVNEGQVSTTQIQRRFKLGYARAGRIVDEMEKRGIISQKDGAKPRLCLISRDEYEQMKASGALEE